MKQLTELATSFSSIAENSDLPGKSLPWLETLRQQAQTRFETAGLPAKKEEDWKYTSLWSLSQQVFAHQASENTIEQGRVDEAALLDDSYRFVIVDGVFCAEMSRLDSLPEGVSIQPFSQSVSSFEQQLGQQVDLNKAGLTALNTMLP